MLEGLLFDCVDDTGHCHGSGLHVRMVVPPLCCSAVLVRYHIPCASGPVVVLMSGLPHDHEFRRFPVASRLVSVMCLCRYAIVQYNEDN